MNLQDAFNDWLLHIAHEKGMSRTSRTTYGTNMRRLLRWLEEDGGSPGLPLDAFNATALRRFNYALGKAGLKPTTVRGIFNAVRGFGDFLVRVGALTENPAKTICLPKKNAPSRTECTDVQVQMLLDGCERIANSRRAALARAIVSTFAYAGLRRTEALSLRVQDIDLQAKTCTITNGKGGKRRTVPVCDACAHAWREWLAHRESDAPCDWLFLENRSRRLWQDGLHVLWEEVRAAAGLRHATDLTPHVVRHNFASRLVRNGADLRSVGTLLGHSSLVITDRYVHADTAQVKQAANLAALPPTQPTIAPEPKPTNRPAMRMVTPQDDRQHRNLRRISR